MTTALDAQLLAAHDAGDRAALVGLYTQAADGAGEDRARAFYLTHAYVFALETNHAACAGLRAQLVEMGRESPL